ncbi:MAG: hypothetical protein MUQ10_06310 [Anaerolineae bacterium]|nr:hypothetical protein [Anaerolineae bacterium]
MIGYSLESSEARAGGTIELDLAWRALQPWEKPPSFTLRLIDDNGERLSQADQALDGNVLTGEVRFERLVLPLYPELTPGRYELHLGAYTVIDGEFKNLTVSDEDDSITLTEIYLSPGTQEPHTMHPLAVPFRNGPTLVGVDYDRSLTSDLRVYLNWRGPVWEPGEQVQITTSDGTLATALLPFIEGEAYQTIIVNMPDVQDSALHLSLIGTNGEIIQAAGPWGWERREIALPAAARDARFVPVGGDIAVVGASVRMAAQGKAAIVDVNLVCLAPMTDDLATSVRLMDADGRWLDRHDMQPAQGAIPTLKWIRGSRVVDRHVLSIPDEFTGDTVQAVLVAYERFREITRPVLDGRFRDAPLGSWPLSD